MGIANEFCFLNAERRRGGAEDAELLRAPPRSSALKYGLIHQRVVIPLWLFKVFFITI